MGSLRCLGPTTGAVLAAAVFLAAPAHASVRGPLKFVGCYEGHSGTLGAGCTQANALTGIAQMALDDQGHNLYAAARTAAATGTALAVFDRDPVTGALTQKAGTKGCFSAPGTSEGCTALGTSTSDSPFHRLVDVVVTHDGANVYAVGRSGALATFSRDTTTGELTYQGCIESQAVATVTGCNKTGINGLSDPTSIAVSPDDVNVYVANYGPSRIGVFTRNKAIAAFGGLSQPAAADPSPYCVTQDQSDDNGTAGKCVQSTIVSRPTQVSVTPDGKQLIVASEGGTQFIAANVSALNRGASGELGVPAGPFAAGEGRCVSADGSGDAAGTCLTNSRVQVPAQFALNAAGSRMYVAGRYTASLLTIDRDTGAAAFVLHAGASGCVLNVSPTPPACSFGDGMLEPYDVAIGDDGKSVYMTALSNHTITEYDVVQADGGLTQKPPPFGCIYGGAHPNCTKLITDSPAEGIVASPDGRNVYVGLNIGVNDDRILAFAVDRPPACNALGASTPFNTALTLQLSCPDADGDANAFAVAIQPAHGTLGAVQPDGKVSYGPPIGFSGADAFTFHAVTPIVTAPGATPAQLGSDDTTFNIDVQPQQTQNPPPTTTTPTPRITSPIKKKFLAGKRFTKVLKLTFTAIPVGAAAKLKCKGGKRLGCPFKSKKVPVKAGDADATPLLKKAKLRPKAVLDFVITKPGAIGKLVRFSFRKNKQPSSRTLCVPVGSSTPQSSCGS